MSILTIMGYIVSCIVGIVLLLFAVVILQYVMYFQFHSCKHCGHHMEYKGLKEDSAEGHYLFHCPKCGAWEQIPKAEYLRDLDKGFDPNRDIT